MMATFSASLKIVIRSSVIIPGVLTALAVRRETLYRIMALSDLKSLSKILISVSALSNSPKSIIFLISRCLGNLSPGAIDTELTDHISDKEMKQGIDEVYKDAIKPDAIARAFNYAINEPEESSVNEFIIRPSSQNL